MQKCNWNQTDAEEACHWKKLTEPAHCNKIIFSPTMSSFKRSLIQTDHNGNFIKLVELFGKQFCVLVNI